MDEKPSQQGKRLVFLFAGLIDALLGGAVLLIYFGVLPVNLAEYGIPRWVVGVAGGIWALSGAIVLLYQLTRLRLED